MRIDTNAPMQSAGTTTAIAVYDPNFSASPIPVATTAATGAAMPEMATTAKVATGNGMAKKVVILAAIGIGVYLVWKFFINKK